MSRKIGIILNTDSELIDVIYCFDENYNYQTITSVYSFLSNYSGLVRLHFLNNNSEKFKKLITHINKFQNVTSINVYQHEKDKGFIYPAVANHHATEATYYRLFIDKYLTTDVKNLIYFDSDIITINDVSHEIKKIFHNLKKNNYYIGAVNYTIKNDYGEINESNQEMLNELNMKSKKYFNAGVLFLNYEKWQEDNLNEKIIEHSKSMGNLEKLKMHDQDILNSFFDGDFLNLDRWLNYALIEENFAKDEKKILENAKFVHYLGSQKPWLLNGFYNISSKFYQNVFRVINQRSHLVFDINYGLKDIKNNFRVSDVLKPKKIYSYLRVLKSYLFKV